MADTTADRVAQVLAAAARGSYDRSTMDVIDYVLYDQNLFAATTLPSTTSFFTTAIGGAYGGGVKTISETNMQLQGQLPSSQYFVINEWSVALNTMIVGADVDQNTVLNAYFMIMSASTFSLKLSGREFDVQVPGSVFIPPVISAGLNSAANGVSVGEYTSSGWMSMRMPIVIEGGAAFSVLQAAGSAVAANQTILNTASNTLNVQVAAMQIRLKGVLVRFK